MSQPDGNNYDRDERRGPWHELNGYRIPLVVDGAMIISGIIFGTVLWSDMQQLKNERINAVSVARVAVLEEQVKQMKENEARLNKENEQRDERSRQDRERMWDQIERMGGHRR